MIDEQTLAQINGPYKCPPDAGPAWRAACNYGFDMSLVDCALELSPEKRLEECQYFVNQIVELDAARERLASKTQNNRELLARLCHNRVQFVLTGCLCGAIHGSSILTTTNLEVCSPLSGAYLDRISTALADLHPVQRPIVHQSHQLRKSVQAKQLYIETDIGNVVCWPFLAGVGDYEACLQGATILQLSFGDLPVLTIEALIATRAASGSEDDLAIVKQLLAIKEKFGHNITKPPP